MKTLKTLILAFAALMLAFQTMAQVPQVLKYQTVVRNADGEIMNGQNVGFRFNIHHLNPTGIVVYCETHSAVTNEFGLVNLNIGSGVPVLGTFSAIDWGSGSKFLEVEIDPAGGSSFSTLGTSQLLSVPYALYAENTANNDDADADPDNELQTLAIEGNNLSISDGNTVELPGSGINNRISDNDGDTWIDVERTGDNDSIIFTTFGMERMKISNNGYVEVNGQMIATGFIGDGSGLTGLHGDNLGDHTATEDLDMDGNAITNLENPTIDSDAATKGYVDAHPGDNLGNHTAANDLNMNNHSITNLVNPLNSSDAATKGYVDTKPGDNLGNHSATQNLAIGNNWISNDGNIEGISISQDGFVGINSAMPDQSLTVNGNLRVSDQVMAGFGTSSSASYRFGAGYENSGLSSPVANSIAFITDGTQRMIVSQNGNVGIGTNNPAKNLHVQGTFRLADGSQANGRVLTSDAFGTAYWSEPSSIVQNQWHTNGNSGTVSGSNFIGTTDAQELDFRTNNIIRTRITGKGQIETLNTGKSVFIGEGAGENDDNSENRNIAIGYEALLSNTSGSNNCATGYRAMDENTIGFGNSAFGYASLTENIGGSNNTAIGSHALFHSTNISKLVAVGDSALFWNGLGATEWYEGTCNTAVGSGAMLSNTLGHRNSASGYQALYSNTEGNYNSAYGYKALYSNTDEYENSAFGCSALYSNTGGHCNSSFGSSALGANTDGNYNSAFGRMTLDQNTIGDYNSAFGEGAMMYNTIGEGNSAFGIHALLWNTEGHNNCAVGNSALAYNETGDYNTALGSWAFSDGIAYSNSTAIGSLSEISASNQVRIGNSSVTSIGGYAGWTNLSDARFKKNVKENVPGLDFILKLKPVTYNVDVENLNNFLSIPDSISKADDFLVKSMDEKSQMVQTGFIAQDVEVIASQLGFDFSGIDKPKNENDHYGLRYAEFVVPLVKAVQEQQEIIEQLRVEIELLKSKQPKN